MSDSSLGGLAWRLYAKTGGVIGVNGLGEFLDHHEATSRSMFRHIDYMARLVDPQHVAIDLDFSKKTDAFWASVLNSSAALAAEPEPQADGNEARTPRSARRAVDLILEAGYAEEEIRGILGGNLRRVAGQVWKQSGAGPAAATS